MFRIVWTVAVCGLVSSLGCGGGSSGGVPVYPVSGTVTMDGGPVAGAAVTFAPKENQPAAAGRTDSQGNFVLTTYTGGDGAAEGEYVVLVRKYAESAPSSSNDEDAGHRHQPGAAVVDPGHGAKGKQDADETGNLLPGNFGNKDTSPLSATVTKDGDNKFELKLE